MNLRDALFRRRVAEADRIFINPGDWHAFAPFDCVYPDPIVPRGMVSFGSTQSFLTWRGEPGTRLIVGDPEGMPSNGLSIIREIRKL